jgi:hypothetical protein
MGLYRFLPCLFLRDSHGGGGSFACLRPARLGDNDEQESDPVATEECDPCIRRYLNREITQIAMAWEFSVLSFVWLSPRLLQYVVASTFPITNCLVERQSALSNKVKY